jgi:hypothetical protein
LARLDGRRYQQTFETVAGYSNGPFEPAAPKHTINLEGEKQPTPDTYLGTKNHLMYADVVDQGHLYTDLTGKLPVRSSKGKSYVMVCYIYDCNYVKVIPMKSRSASEWVKSYDTIHQELTVKGFKPKLQTLDNKASTALKNFFTEHDISYQLLPPHCHRRNAAERAIRTFKEHFVAGLSSAVTNPSLCTCGTDSCHTRKSR